jgi:hypothetical protein
LKGCRSSPAPLAGRAPGGSAGQGAVCAGEPGVCGDPGQPSFVTCSNFAPPGEPESTVAQLTSGQSVTVIVDGFRPVDAGNFELTATFTPQ